MSCFGALSRLGERGIEKIFLVWGETEPVQFYLGLSSQVEVDEMDRTFNTNWAKRNAFRMLVGKPEGKRSLGRPRRRWV
jgi:hypothetical protein